MDSLLYMVQLPSSSTHMPIKLARIKKTGHNRYWPGCGGTETLIIAGGNVKWYTPFGNQCNSFFKIQGCICQNKIHISAVSSAFKDTLALSLSEREAIWLKESGLNGMCVWFPESMLSLWLHVWRGLFLPLGTQHSPQQAFSLAWNRRGNPPWWPVFHSLTSEGSQSQPPSMKHLCTLQHVTLVSRHSHLRWMFSPFFRWKQYWIHASSLAFVPPCSVANVFIPPPHG